MPTKKQTTKKKQETFPVGSFVLEFKPKYERAVANLISTVGENYTEEQLLAEYDRLGGRITYEGENVKMGAFWDFKTKKAVEDPKPKVVKKQVIVEEEIELDVPVKKTKKNEDK